MTKVTISPRRKMLRVRTKSPKKKHSSKETNMDIKQNRSKNIKSQMTTNSKRESTSHGKERFQNELSSLMQGLPQIHSPKIQKSPLLTKEQI